MTTYDTLHTVGGEDFLVKWVVRPFHFVWEASFNSPQAQIILIEHKGMIFLTQNIK